ncbi:MAG: Actin-like protein ATPase involved in cell division-like protein [Candidatus Berkelbacteria bacterium]|nr:Actin-like protein ATPase involved in cell division-like protein [Candidatus Berkelbacteria bacterium]
MGLFDFLGTNKIENRYALALDIGTEFAKCLIFKVEEDKGIVVGSGRQRQKLSDMQGGGVTDIHGVVKNCQKAIERAASQAQVMPTQVIMGIAGELVKGNTTTIKYTRPDPKIGITLEELKDIISKIQRRSFDRARQILAWETGHAEVDVRLVNAAIVDVKIDGYKVTNPLGFQGRELQVGVFNAFAPIVHLGALQTIAAELHLDLLSVVADPYALARSVGPKESTEFNAIFIDIGGGTSDIAVVRQGGVEGTKMFALGGRSFTKRIAQVFGSTFSEAEDLKIKYCQGKADKEDAAFIKNALQTDCQVWLSGVELTLEEFSALELLPSRILLCGGGAMLPDIQEILKNARWSSNLPFARQPTVHFIKPEDVENIEDKTGELKNPWDITPMSLANLGIDLVGEEKITDSILNRIVNSLRE